MKMISLGRAILPSFTLLLILPSSGANYTYRGAGSDPNDWLDGANWGGGGGAADWPTSEDNALFQSAQGMSISQAVPVHGQLQVGRGIANEVSIVSGGVVTNTNQTIVGIQNNGEGSLLVDGGSLVTKALRLNVFGSGSVLSQNSIVRLTGGSIHVDASFGGDNAGDLDLGLDESATVEVSGGSLLVDNNLDFTAGTLKIQGTAGTIDIGNSLNLENEAGISYITNTAGEITTITADSFNSSGTPIITVDASLAAPETIQNLVLIDLGNDTFSEAELAALSSNLTLVNIPTGSLSLNATGDQLLFTNAPPPPPSTIVSSEVIGETIRLVIDAKDPLEDLMLLRSEDLSADSWTLTPFSLSSSGPFLQTNLSAALPNNGYYEIYVPIIGEKSFFTLDSTPQSSWFTVVANSDESAVTHRLVSGAMTVGVSELGGGFINEISLPGIGDIMGPQADRFGRGGQSAMRDRLHNLVYNPTQAGYSDPAGTICRVVPSADGKTLVVAPRPATLYNGDGQYDFNQWENLVADAYKDDGGFSDEDGINETTLDGQQATELTSEFDYYGTYEDILGTTGTSYLGTCEITIPAVRHYFEYRYVRDPGHALSQFGPGTSEYKPNNGTVTDFSVAQPAGVHASGPNDMGVMIYSISVRYDREIWAPPYVGLVTGPAIGDIRMLERPSDGTGLTLRDIHYNTVLQSRIPNPEDVHAPVAVPLFMIAENDDIDAPGALGLYYPHSRTNQFSVIGADRQTGAVIYEDDRRLQVDLRDVSRRIPLMSLSGFRGIHLGLMNPTRLPSTQYEAMRSEFYILYGSPREIFENAKRIHPF
ncbi:hypothetical protein ACFQY0_02425 [Haloferula chungangensis]|uniref:Uncharacterized protein n=1 Tax=Haloferula chungangensis TaxID=1048331 RepID=A0ABW2L400_9BACT